MSNKFSNRRYNKLLSYRNNYYKDGTSYLDNSSPNLGILGTDNYGEYLRSPYSSYGVTDLAPVNKETTTLSQGIIDAINKETAAQLPTNNSFNSGKLNSAINVAGGLVGNILSGGMHSGVGDTIGSLSSIASAIPGPWGAVASAGLKAVGGITNGLFGSNLNQENIAKLNGNINKLNNTVSDANSFDTLAQNMSNSQISFNKNYIGKEGLFSHTAKNKYNQLKNDYNNALAYAENSQEDNASYLRNLQLNTMNANYAAMGGDLNTNGGNFPTGLTYINEGGSHEENPYGGIMLGTDSEGKPNLLEEGEVVFNNYVFSNRLTVPNSVRNKYKLRGTKDLTFADAAKQLSKSVEERPNDQISNDTLRDTMMDLAQAQEGIREKEHQGNRFAKGGFTYTPYKYVPGYNGGWFDKDNKYTKEYLDKVNNMSIADINNAFNEQYKYYTNDKNKNTDRWKAIDAFYTANPQYKTNNTNLTDDALPTIRQLATDGNPGFMHQFFNDANPIKRANRYFLRGTDAKGNPTVTPMSITPWEGLNDKGQTFNEAFPNYIARGSQVRPVENNTIYTDYYYDENNNAANSEENNPLDLGTADENLRYIPAIGLGLASISDALGLTNKPDYNEAGIIEGVANRGNYKSVAWNPIGNKLAYNPFDIDYSTNKLNAQAAATRRAIENQSSGNSGRAIAGLLAADYASQNAIGDAYRKAVEDNLNQRFKVEEFNRGTNQANSQGMLQADSANQQAAANARDFAFRGLLSAAELRQKERLASDQAKSANLSGLFQALGDIGYENKSMNMIRRMAEAGIFGPLSEPMIKNVATKKAYNKNLTRRR